MEYYIVNAFTSSSFGGNPAGVCVTKKPLPNQLMQRIAYENRLPETAFLTTDEFGFHLKWFTPLNEIDLCGHATLAAAYVVMNFLKPALSVVEFQTMSGRIAVRRNNDRYELTLPVRTPEKISLTRDLAENLNAAPVEIYSGRDLFVILDNEAAVRSYVPDYDKLARLNKWLGVVITAEGSEVDFVSRYFCPELRDEDPVTGSSHCSLIPIWCKKLNKSSFIAKQLSSRGGLLYCREAGDKILVSGEACLYLKGELTLNGNLMGIGPER